ncbi:MAG: hypothetical protein PHQ28_02985 [Mycobacterium sp.]|nr:hypothetical protein [Mycobacterium sp.]
MATSEFARNVQIACDDLYVDPDSPVAKARLRALLGTSPGAMALTSATEYKRRLMIACDELHDDPDDIDAQHTLLMLLSGPTPSPVAVA